jgi:hypothetical protein
LGIAKKYNRVANVVQPMMVTILLKDTIVTLHQLHPLPLDHVLPLTFNYQPEHTFVMDSSLFAQA